MIHGLPAKSGKSDWLRIRNKYSAHTQKIGSDQSSRALDPCHRSEGSRALGTGSVSYELENLFRHLVLLEIIVLLLLIMVDFLTL